MVLWLNNATVSLIKLAALLFDMPRCRFVRNLLRWLTFLTWQCVSSHLLNIFLVLTCKPTDFSLTYNIRVHLCLNKLISSRIYICSMQGFPVLHYLLELAQTHVCLVSNAIQLSYPLLPPVASCPQSFLASGSFPVNQLFASGGQSIGSFSFNICPSNEYSGLISFRIDWFDLFAVQGTLKSLLQQSLWT